MEVTKRTSQYTPLRIVNNKHTVIMWDLKPITKTNAKGETVESPLAVWQEYEFDHIASLSEIKSVITHYYNEKIDEKIISGLVWKGMNVWLSSENQFNYKVAYDLAVQTNGASLPMTFKFGSNEDVVYYEFKTLEDLADFYMSSINHIQATLQEGWILKDSINWELYENS